MSLPGISDFILNDILTEIKMKPWWEKIRGYFYAGSVAISLCIFYLTVTMKVGCVPISRNNTLDVDITLCHIQMINIYCPGQMPWFVSYLGLITTACTLLILFASVYWLQMPGVIKAFNTFKKAEELIEELSNENEKLQSSVNKPFLNESDARVREAYRLLMLYNSSTDINRRYLVRNIILLATIMTSVVFQSYVLHSLIAGEDNFDCSLSQRDQKKLNQAGNHLKYFCSQSTTRQIIPFCFGSILAAIMQLILVVIGMWKIGSTCNSKREQRVDNNTQTRESSEDQSHEGTALISVTDNHAESPKINKDKIIHLKNFMLQFWLSSHPSRSGKFNDIVEKWFFYKKLEELDKIMKIAEKRGCTQKEIETFSFTQDPNDYRLLKKIVYQLKKEGIDEEKAIIELQNIHISTSNHHAKRLIKIAQTRHLFLLIVHVISRLNDEEHKCKDFVKSLNLSLDELYYETLSSNAGSILYHALNETEYYEAAEYILGAMKDGRRKYVHWWSHRNRCYITKRAGDFLQQNFDQDPNKRDILLRLFVESEQNGTEPSKSQNILEQLFHKLEDCPHEQLFSVAIDIKNELSACRFTIWDENAKQLGQYAIRNKLWEIFVTLINSYITTYEVPGLRKVDCGVEQFDNWETVLLMAGQEANKGFGLKAVEHILACTLPQEQGRPHPGMENVKRTIQRYELITKIERKFEHSMRQFETAEVDTDGEGTS